MSVPDLQALSTKSCEVKRAAVAIFAVALALALVNLVVDIEISTVHH
jgi:hypothetical protein